MRRVKALKGCGIFQEDACLCKGNLTRRVGRVDQRHDPAMSNGLNGYVSVGVWVWREGILIYRLGLCTLKDAVALASVKPERHCADDEGFTSCRQINPHYHDLHVHLAMRTVSKSLY